MPLAGLSTIGDQSMSQDEPEKCFSLRPSYQVCPEFSFNAPLPSFKTTSWLLRNQCKQRFAPQAQPNANSILSFLKTLLISLLILNFSPSVKPQLTSSDIIASNIVNQHMKGSDNLSISQICGKSQIPPTIKTEGAVLTSSQDVDVDCTITFRTRAQQYFVVRFEDLRLDCNDHLKMIDADADYGQWPIKDFSCADNLAGTPIIKTTGSYLTIHYRTDSKTKIGDGFRLVITATVQGNECPIDYALCTNGLCISKSLFCDGINHCTNNLDEKQCSSRSLDGASGGQSGSLLSGDLSLANALGLLVVIVLIIFACVTLFISAVYCRRDDPYNQQYQHHLQRAIGLPLQTSSSLMFANHQPQYHYFQPANFSPYVTPQHHAAIASTLPRGFSAVPVGLTRQAFQVQQPTIIQGHPQIVVNPANNMLANSMNSNSEYMMTSKFQGSPVASCGKPPASSLPQSQSILAGPIQSQASIQDMAARSSTLGRQKQ